MRETIKIFLKFMIFWIVAVYLVFAFVSNDMNWINQEDPFISFLSRFIYLFTIVMASLGSTGIYNYHKFYD